MNCRLPAKPTYLHGVVKKGNVKAWLGVLLLSPLYKHHKMMLNPNTFASIPGDADVDDEEIEKWTLVDDMNDPKHCVVAMNASRETLMYEVKLTDLELPSNFLVIAPAKG